VSDVDTVAMWIGIVSGIIAILGFFGITGWRQLFSFPAPSPTVIEGAAEWLAILAQIAALLALALPWAFVSYTGSSIGIAPLGWHGMWAWPLTVGDVALIACASALKSPSATPKRAGLALLIPLVSLLCLAGGVVLAARKVGYLGHDPLDAVGGSPLLGGWVFLGGSAAVVLAAVLHLVAKPRK
jgi:hypothetical protein